MSGLILRSGSSVRVRELTELQRVAGETFEGKAEVIAIPEALRIRRALRQSAGQSRSSSRERKTEPGRRVHRESESSIHPRGSPTRRYAAEQNGASRETPSRQSYPGPYAEGSRRGHKPETIRHEPGLPPGGGPLQQNVRRCRAI